MNYLKEAFRIIKKRNKSYYFMIAIIFFILFFQSFFSGQHLYRTDQAAAEEIIGMFANSSKVEFISAAFNDGNYLLAAVTIFSNNFLIDTVSLYLGVTFLVPVFLLLSNAIFLGLIFGITSLIPPGTSFLHLFWISIVGMIELSSLFLVTYESLRIGMSLFIPERFGKRTRKEAFKQTILEGSKVLFLVMLLLILAATIETAGILFFQSRFVY